MSVVLWHIEVSHYNEKVRWALDYKGIPHERRAPLPGMHGLPALVLTRGRQRRLPVIKLDGKRIGDSTAIIAALERYRPDPPLYPDDPQDRERALALEDFFDEHLAPEVRRFIWHHTLGDASATADVVVQSGGARAQVLKTLIPVMRPVVRADYKVSADGAVQALRNIRAAMDRVEQELRPSGYLVGDRFSVADLTAASLFTPLLAPPERQYAPATLSPPVMEVRAELEGREGGAWVAEMFARHRPASAETRV